MFSRSLRRNSCTALALGALLVGSSAGAQQVAPAPTPAVEAAPAANTGRLRVVVNRPGTHVWLGGRDVGVAPLELDLAARAWDVRLEAPGHRAWSGPVTITAGSLVPLRAMLMPAPSRGWAWASAGVAGLSAALALTFGLVSNAAYAGAQDARSHGWLDNNDNRFDRGQALALGADTALVTTALFTALAIYLFVEGPGARSSARAGRPRPLLSPVTP